MNILPFLITISFIGAIFSIIMLLLSLHEEKRLRQVDKDYYDARIKISERLSDELMAIIKRYSRHSGTSSTWKSILGISELHQVVSVEEVKERYAALARIYHPDKTTGSVAKMQRLNAARDQALKEIG